MAKTPLGGSFGPRRGVSIKGRFYTVETPNGILIKRWPRRQPTPRTQAEADNRALLAKAARFTAYMSSRSQQFAREVANSSKLLPRDLLMIALFNRLGYVVQRDGRKIYAMVAMQDVSALLDALGQLPGSILVRGDTWWTYIALGAEGDQLIVGPDGLPEWQAPPEVASGGAPFLSADQLNPTIAGLTIGPGDWIGLPIVPPADLTLNGITVPVTAIGTGRVITVGLYQANLASLSGATLLAQSIPTPAVAGLQEISFAAPAQILKNTFYYIGMRVSLGTGNLQVMRSLITKDNYMYFSAPTTSLPSTAPAATAGTGGAQFSWWAF